MKKIELNSVNNVRDFSYQNIKEKTLLRSASLDNISDDDFNILYNDYNLRTIIDLRADYEKTGNLKDRFNINYYNIPLIEEEDFITKPKNVNEIIMTFLKSMPNETVKSEKYVKLLESKKAWSKIFDILLNNKEGSILICCHQGKDRTGVVCALILSLLEIDYNTIVDDYLLSNDLLKEKTDSLYKKVIEVAKLNNLPLINKKALEANKEYIDYVFSSIKEKYNSLEEFYKKHCNLDDNKINLLKEKYCK